jgi:hypothetical protein
MPLQSQNLIMAGLGVQGDVPPNPEQPPLRNGIHLRWAFRRELGFPWHGFFLYRRRHRPGDPLCLSNAIRQVQPGRWPGSEMTTPLGRVDSDQILELTDTFPAPGAVEFDLDRRSFLRFTLPPAEPARWVRVTIGFRKDTEIRVTIRFGEVPVGQKTVKGRAGDVIVEILESDAISSVEIGPGPAALVDLCNVPVSQDATRGWELLGDFTYPMTLPVFHPAYPCNPGPENEVTAQALALGRVVYGPQGPWAGGFADLHKRLVLLVGGGPAGPAMVDRTTVEPGSLVPPDPAAQPVAMPAQRPLDLILLGSLHAAFAQLIGLYWVDRKPDPALSYDYLIAADRLGSSQRNPKRLLDILAASGFAQVDGFIAFNKRMAPAPALAAPTGLRTFALPGGTFRRRDGDTADATNNAGLRWSLERTEAGLLLPGRSVLYHLWRANRGNAAAPAPPGPFTLLTKARPLLVTEPNLPPGVHPERPPDWPPEPLHAIDRGLADGWYGYQVNGIDLFGRHTPNSAAASWHQWAPVPDPRPWYYQDPPSDAAIHPSAVRLLDKIPPPFPPVEAFALDPADPTVLKDAAWTAWRASLSPAERETVIGLRVRWHWTEGHMRQAPDTREFRIYFNPGTNPPAQHGLARSWQDRLYVVGYNQNVQETVDADGRPLRRYEIFLPAPGDAVRTGLPLATSPADPIAYANVGVSAADDKTHTADDPKWAATRWGGRTGNEGRVGGPAKVFRVHRQRPPAPVPPPDSERVFATPADYHHRSFYTYRWRPSANLKTHVFRALDDAVFKVDRTRRPRPALTAGQLEFFPAEPRWDAMKRAQVAAELNALNGAPLAAYRSLSNDALRVLAGLPGNEKAFTQLTVQPLDPADAATANRPGPDNPANFPVDAALRLFTDTLDGRSTNRYFYRAAYVDSVHNRGPLSLSGPPVWLPDVVSPRIPVLTKVLGSDREITLRWASNREPDLAAYRVYRAEGREDARDLRLMTLVHTEAVPPGDPAARPAEVVWSDRPVPALTGITYRLTAVDAAGNESPPSPALSARAYRAVPPDPPDWVDAVRLDEGGEPVVRLTWALSESLEVLVQRRVADRAVWSTAAAWLPAGTTTFDDAAADPAVEYEYRLKGRDAARQQSEAGDGLIVPALP